MYIVELFAINISFLLYTINFRYIAFEYNTIFYTIRKEI